MSKVILMVCVLMISISTGAQERIPNEELMGKGNPELSGSRDRLRKEAYECFLQMKTAAEKDGISLTIASGYRDYNRQRAIWENKYKRYIREGMSPGEAASKIVEYSTIPGTSRHHWGTDADIVDGNVKVSGDVLKADNFEEGGPYRKMKLWMDKHAAEFGFYLVYTNDPGRKGFKYEPWHYSFAPLSVSYLKQYRKIDIKKVLERDGIKGKEALTDEFLKKYFEENVLDINPELL